MQKWGLYRIHHTECQVPHDKYCICICPDNGWFFFINTEPPAARKARELAVLVSADQITPLSHTSYIDTTFLIRMNIDAVEAAAQNPSCDYGQISPTLRAEIVSTVMSHNVLIDEHRYLVTHDE